ncbi:TetR family transcriptional regulator [Kitasatospora sp. NPDC093806]|uniref:TetR family transcriptional regulator n=1 Tax=Kitasatospora sp. NPDC093806 TaxID=3155075 RepID=UPI003439F5B0
MLDAAEEVLVTPGGAELTMRAVAAAAGVRLGHLQYYFPTHADLVAAVLERVLQRSAERLAPLLAPGDTSGGMTGAVTGRASGDTPEGSPVAAVAAPLAPNDASGGNAAEVVTALLAEQEDARLMRLFAEVWALAARDPAVAGAVRRFYDDYRDQLTAFLARTRPELPEAVRRARAGVFVMLIEGASLFRSGVAGEREPGTDAELVRAALALLGP